MKKLKLLFSISTLCFAIAVLCFGVLAATSVTYTIQGTISYDVEDVYVDVNTTVYKSAKYLSATEQSSLVETLGDPANLTTAKTDYELVETGGSDSFSTLNTESPTPFDGLELTFNKDVKTYAIVVNVKNLTDKNAWAVVDKILVDDDVYEGYNIKVINNYQLEISKTADTNGKNVVIVVTPKDVTKQIVNGRTFTFNLIFGSGAYVDSTTNMSKMTIAEDKSVTKASYDISGVLVIPSSVTSIGDDAFSDCYYLINVEIPSSVTSIGSYAFAYCEELTSITIPSSVKSIGWSAFAECTILESVTISEGITIIDSDTFNYCISLISVSIPSSVTSIGSDAFRDCWSLTNITIPSSVTSIERGAFQACLSLPSITIPSSVTSIEDGAFAGCSGLESITVSGTDGTYTAQDNCLIKGTELVVGCKASVIPSSVTSIGSRAFSGCSSLPSITIPSSVTSIGNGAFDGCTGLTSITIPSSVTSIGSQAFWNCSSLTSIEISSGVTSIGDSAFEGCISLTSIEIPSSVTSIGERAFMSCRSLTSIEIPSSVTSIEERAFENTPWLANLPADSNGLKIVTSSDNANVKFLFGYTGNLSTITAEMLSGVQVICGGGVFKDNKTLRSITIPSSVTNIGSDAFYGCSNLTGITLPSSVTSIGDDAFYNTPWLKNLTADSNGLKIVTSSDKANVKFLLGYTGSVATITAEMLSGVQVICGSVFENNKTLQSITIPSSVTSIGSDAFSNCSSLTSIEIPSSVTSIGGWAFYECSGLTTINFTGTQVQWNAISKSSAMIKTGVNVVCTDGTIVTAE